MACCSSNTIPAGNNSGLYGNPAGVSQSVSNYGNTQVAAFLPTYTGNLGNVGNITASGNIVGNTIVGNSFTYANGVSIIQTNNYGNSQVAQYLPVNTANIAAPNLSITGTARIGTVQTNNYQYANGAPVNFTNYGNSNVAAYLPTYNGLLNACTVAASYVGVGNVDRKSVV